MDGWREARFKALRNTATLQAWRRRERAAMGAGLPFIFAPTVFSGVFAALAGRLFHHGGPMALLLVCGWLASVAASMTVGVVVMRRYRRRHPFDVMAR